MGSIGDAAFAANLAAGVAAAAEGDTVDPTDVDSEMQELLSFAEKQLSIGGAGEAGGIPAGGLMEAPVATQQEIDIGDDEDDDRALELLKEKYPTLNAKTYRMKDLMAEMAEFEMTSDPYELMTTMHDTVEGMPDGEDKMQSVQVFNAVSAVFECARTNSGLRDFCAEVFNAQKQYCDTKARKFEVTTELKQLGKLYDDELYMKAMADLERKKTERMAMLEKKGKVKAEKAAAKAAATAKAAAASSGSASKKQKM